MSMPAGQASHRGDTVVVVNVQQLLQTNFAVGLQSRVRVDKAIPSLTVLAGLHPPRNPSPLNVTTQSPQLP
jgi:hypothetical protein